jgi:hypothetical protein
MIHGSRVVETLANQAAVSHGPVGAVAVVCVTPPRWPRRTPEAGATTSRGSPRSLRTAWGQGGHWTDGDPDVWIVMDSRYDVTRSAFVLADMPVQLPAPDQPPAPRPAAMAVRPLVREPVASPVAHGVETQLGQQVSGDAAVVASIQVTGDMLEAMARPELGRGPESVPAAENRAGSPRPR